MKTHYVLILLSSVYCLFFSPKVLAGSADLELVIESDLSEGVGFGQIGSFSITVTNHGPDDAGSNSSRPYPIVIFNSPLYPSENNGQLELFFGQENANQTCFFLLAVIEPLPGGQFPGYIFSFNFPVIPANTSITCHGQYLVNFEQGEREVGWRALNVTDTDPNPDNDRATMVFKINPPVIPSTSSWSVLVLIGLIFLFMMRFYYRRH
ncbi:MAG: DUF11 domain-containing protein [Proteobacteria bacterium]|nr:DUF11 domain-containing protein [Pseudomonadota bacterium]